MLSLMNEVDPYVASAVDFVWDAKLVFPTNGIRISILVHVLVNQVQNSLSLINAKLCKNI